VLVYLHMPGTAKIPGTNALTVPSATSRMSAGSAPGEEDGGGGGGKPLGPVMHRGDSQRRILVSRRMPWTRIDAGVATCRSLKSQEFRFL
jgi:hypothetical protein